MLKLSLRGGGRRRGWPHAAALGALAGLLALAAPPGGSTVMPQSAPVAAPSAGSGAGQEVAAELAPGGSRDGTVAAGEVLAWRVAVAGAPLLVVVEQRGIDLVVSDRGSAGGEAIEVDAPNRRWGPELLLLEAAGEHRIEVRPGGAAVPPGGYAIRITALGGDGSAAGVSGAPGLAAARAMTRGGREAAGPAEAQRRALAAYREALAAWQALGERALAAEALSAVADLEHQLEDLRAAAADYTLAVARWRELDAPHRAADLLDQLGLTRLELGDGAGARAAIGEALAGWRRLGERFEEAATLIDAGLVEHRSGVVGAAVAPYQEARAILHRLGARGEEARALNNLGGAYDLLGDADAALASYREALALDRALGDAAAQAQALNNLAVLDRRLGEWQAALDAYGEAGALLARLHRRPQQAALLLNLGYLYNTLGEPERARALFEEALALDRAAADRRGEIAVHIALGLAWRGLGDLERAAAQQRAALGLARALGEPRQEAQALLRLAEVRLERGDGTVAADLERALALLRQAGNRRGEAEALALAGRARALAFSSGSAASSSRPTTSISSSSSISSTSSAPSTPSTFSTPSTPSAPSEAEAALGLLRQALDRWRELRDRAGEAETLDDLAAVERRLGRDAEAQAHAEAAVGAIEDLRQGLVSPGLRAAFLATRHRAYTLLIDLLMERHRREARAGWDRQALAVSERSRARSLIDLLREERNDRGERAESAEGNGRDGSGSGAGAGGSAGGAGGAAEVHARRRALVYRLNVLAERQEQVRQGRGQGGDAAALERQLQELLAELDGVDAEIRRAAAGVPGPAAEPLDAAAIGALARDGTLLLELALGEERSFAWAVGEQGVRGVVLPGARRLEGLARRLYAALSTRDADGAAASGRTLARLVLEPVWAEVARARRLVVVPDAALALVPWSALPVPPAGAGWGGAGRVPLIEEKEVVEVPSATALLAARRRRAARPAAPLLAAVLADPVFGPDDPRLAAARHGPVERAGETGMAPLARLPATRREAAAIARLAPAGEVWQALGFAANREAVLAGVLRDFRVVHFATHAVADTRNPELSGLALSRLDGGGRPQEGFLRLADLHDLELRADLVVLSGCRTAIGKQVRGEGLMGLMRGFAAAGVPRVVATLWQIDDRATAGAMERFYRALWRHGERPAAALRSAQRALRRDPRTRDPYCWAGFVHLGDWQ